MATVSSDLPEFKALVDLAELDPEKVIAALSDPQHLFDHLSLEDLNRLRASWERFAVLQRELSSAMDVYTAYGKGLLEGMALVKNAD